MKKIIFPVLLFMSLSTFAQKFEFGLKAGANISNFTGGTFTDVDKKALVGFHGGAYVAFLLGNNFMIQPEALFSTQGAKFKDVDGDTKYKVNYLNVPVMLKFRSTGGFFVEAGPQVGFRLNESIPDQTVGNFAKSLDLSVAGGIGYQSPIGLGIGARYIAGLSKVGDFDASQGVDPDFKNGVIQVGIFYTFFHKK